MNLYPARSRNVLLHLGSRREDGSDYFETFPQNILFLFKMVPLESGYCQQFNGTNIVKMAMRWIIFSPFFSRSKNEFVRRSTCAPI